MDTCEPLRTIDERRNRPPNRGGGTMINIASITWTKII